MINAKRTPHLNSKNRDLNDFAYAFGTDYQEYSDYPKNTVYHNLFCHFVVAQKL